LAVLSGAALLLAGCAAAPWDLESLERRHPALAAVPGHRLQDVTPYLLPRDGAVTWFLCRWPSDEPVRIALPAAASPRERELLELAVQSWAGAGLGLRLELDPGHAAADVTITIGDEASPRAGRTGARCAVSQRGGQKTGPRGGLAARLVSAEVRLERTGHDSLGRPVAFSEPEWLGSALHELGHALGFQGHTRRGGIMVRNVEEVRRQGRRVLAGEPLAAPSVVALYRVASGTRLARRQLPAGRTAAVDALSRLAPDKGYLGPVVEVGDRGARIAWWNAEGRSVGVFVPGVREALRDPGRLSLVPEPLATAWLGRDFAR